MRAPRHRTALLAAATTVIVAASAAVAGQPKLDHRRLFTAGGIELYHRGDDAAPEAALHIDWSADHVAGFEGREGTPVLAPSLLARVLDGTSEGPLSERLADIGAAASFAGEGASFSVVITAPRGQLAAAVSHVFSVFDAPFEAKALERLRLQFIKSIEASERTPSAMAQRALSLLTLSHDDPRRRVLDAASYAAVTLADLETWRTKVVRLEGVRLAASGAVTETEARAIAELLAARLPRRGTPKPVERPVMSAPGKTVVIVRDTPQTVLTMLVPTTATPSPDLHRLTLGVHVLGAGSQGRLQAATRSALGATYGLSAQVAQTAGQPTKVMISGSLSHETAVAAIEAVRSTYRQWREAGVSELELDAARKSVVSSYAVSASQPRSANGVLMASLRLGYTLDDLSLWPDRVRATSRDDVNAALRATMPSLDAFLTVIVAPSADGFDAQCVIASLAEIDRCR